MSIEQDTRPVGPDEDTLAKFRQFTESHIKSFMAAQDRVFHLLGSPQKYASGTYREGLLKDFFRSWLPTAVSVDSGFIYAFGAIPPSAQLDIIIWHSAKHAPVYRGRDFVIVPPEAVITVLSVKSRLDNRDLREGLNNLMSVTPIELRFRQFTPVQGHHLSFPPIAKFLVAYSTRRPTKNVLAYISEHYREIFATNRDLASVIVQIYSRINPLAPSQEDTFSISRILPRMIATVDLKGPSFFVGYGPPDDLLAERHFGPGLRRLPYLYRQLNNRTRSFEKLCFEVLQSVYRVIGTLDWPTTSAWIDVNPVTGVSSGDAWEIDESTGVPLVEPERLVV